MEQLRVRNTVVYQATADDAKNFKQVFEKMKMGGYFDNRVGVLQTPQSNQSKKSLKKALRNVMKYKVKKPFHQQISQIYVNGERSDYFEVVRKLTSRKAAKRKGDKKLLSSMTVREIWEAGLRPEYLKNATEEEVEVAFWTEINRKVKISTRKKNANLATYGSDVAMSWMEQFTDFFSLRKLPTILVEIINIFHANFPGITLPYSYFGAWMACFSVHIEDMDLWSISYLVWGAWKYWYFIAPSDAAKFEALIQTELKPFLLSTFHDCPAYLRHKLLFLKLEILKAHDITVYLHVQQPGQYIILPPNTYHWGFSCGPNYSEAVNFGDPEWIFHALLYKTCTHKSIRQLFPMEFFVYTYMHDVYDDYIAGNLCIVHPLDPTKTLQRVKPPTYELATPNDYNTLESGVNRILVGKMQEEKVVYLATATEKHWVSVETAEKMFWNGFNLQVKIPNSFFEHSTPQPPGILINNILVPPETNGHFPLDINAGNPQQIAQQAVLQPEALEAESREPTIMSSSKTPPQIPTSMKPKLAEMEFTVCPKCGKCSKKFKRPYMFRRHVNACQNGKQFICKLCMRGFTYDFDLKRHQNTSICIRKRARTVVTTPMLNQLNADSVKTFLLQQNQLLLEQT
ncbi:unnamed protein product [Orchesella dallaii]|uniref:JmjC domain-containing protein n=1 Tax=Orchesella dallaii TaxID=48710 RepID=A0ABP1Q864_9HEXA